MLHIDARMVEQPSTTALVSAGLPKVCGSPSWQYMVIAHCTVRLFAPQGAFVL